MAVTTGERLRSGTPRSPEAGHYFYAVLAALVSVAGTAACGKTDRCSAAVRQDIASPNRRWKAVVFSRNCGVLSSPQTGVSILEGPATVRGEYPNVFNVKPALFLSSEDRVAVLENVTVSWTSDSTLTIRYDRRSEVLYQVTRLWGLTVRYSCEEKTANNSTLRC
jgi:hypothetical protein